jgi:hypothetical protein
MIYLGPRIVDADPYSKRPDYLSVSQHFSAFTFILLFIRGTHIVNLHLEVSGTNHRLDITGVY